MTRGLRIFRVLPFWTAAYGGPPGQAQATSRALIARGHEVRVLTTDLGLAPEVPRDRWIEEDGLPIQYRSTRPWHRIPPYRAPWPSRLLASELRSTDVLMLNVGLTWTNDRARRVARRLGVPYVYNAEGALCPVRLQTRRLSKVCFVRLHERRILEQAATLQAVTELERTHLIAAGAPDDRIEVIPNGVALPGPGQHTELRAAGRRSLDVEDDAEVILFLGRIAPGKGVDHCLGALRELAGRRPGLRLVVAGPDGGALVAARIQTIDLGLESKVRFCGPLTGEQREQVFAAADLFVLASHSEGLPNAALEAAARGLPLVVSEQCNLPEVAEFDAGRIVRPDSGEVAEAIEQVLGAPEATDEGLRGDAERRRLGANARRMAEQRFDLDKVVDRLESLARRLTEASPLDRERAPTAEQPPHRESAQSGSTSSDLENANPENSNPNRGAEPQPGSRQ